MLGRKALVVGAILLLAGCTSPSTGERVTPEDDCLLGGPPRAPPEDRRSFSMTEEHLLDHSQLARIFQAEGHTVQLSCGAAMEIIEHLDHEGADVVFKDQPSGHNAYLSHDGTTLFVAMRGIR